MQIVIEKSDLELVLSSLEKANNEGIITDTIFLANSSYHPNTTLFDFIKYDLLEQEDEISNLSPLTSDLNHADFKYV